MRKLGWTLVVGLLSISSVEAQLDVRSFGAVGDGKADDTAAFQKALDEAGKKPGTTVNVSIGNYLIQGNLTIPASTTLEGAWKIPSSFTQNTGSTLLAVADANNEEGPNFITLNSNSCIKGMTIYYPDQDPKSDWPTPYPWTIGTTRRDSQPACDGPTVIDCLLVNSYKMVNFTGAGRHLIRGLYGQALYRGIYIDACYDVGRVENCHIWPFVTVWQDQYKKWNEWQQKNAIAFEFARTDWQNITNCFCFGYAVGFKFSKSPSGVFNGTLTGIGADCCLRAIQVDDCQAGGILITNAQLVGAWGSTESVGLEMGPECTGRVNLSNSAFWGPIDKCVWVRGKNAWLISSTTNYFNWDNTGKGSPAIHVEGGRANISNNTFSVGQMHVLIEKAVKSAIITGNQAIDGFNVNNRAGSRTQMMLNEGPPAEMNVTQRNHYFIQFGSPGDNRYVKDFFAPEYLPPAFPHPTGRTTAQNSVVLLPVNPDKTYEASIVAQIHDEALKDIGDAGVYVDGTKVAPITKGGYQTITFTIPPTKKKAVQLEVRTRIWEPAAVNPESRDTRKLGVLLYKITMKAHGAKSEAYSVHD